MAEFRRGQGKLQHTPVKTATIYDGVIYDGVGG
jgi:hypothetical protein